MSKMKDIGTDLCRDQLWDPEWALQNLLNEGEAVIKLNELKALHKYIEYVLDQTDTKDITILNVIKEDLGKILKESRP